MRWLVLAASAVAVAAAPSPALQEEPAISRTADGVMLDFQDAELRIVISALAELAGMNVVFSDLPATTVTLRTSQPVAEAALPGFLASVARANGLQLVEDEGLVYVSSDAPGEDEAPEPVDSGREPRLFVHRLDHAQAPEIAATLSAAFGGELPLAEQGLSRRGLSADLQQDQGGGLRGQLQRSGAAPADGSAGLASLEGDIRIIPDPATNSLLVYSTPADYETVKAAIEQLDTRPLQVLIEVLIAEVRHEKNFGLGLGLDVPLGDARGGNGGDPTIDPGSPDPPGVDAGSRRDEGTPEPADGTDGPDEVGAAARDAIREGVGFDLPGLSAGDLALRVLHLGRIAVEAVLRVISNSSEVTILSRPVVLAQNNHEARILVGSQRPFVGLFRSLPTDGAIRDQVVQFRDVGTQLTIRPTINPDGFVSLELLQEVSTATEEVQFGAPVISTREAETHLLVKDGNTVVIGGLVDNQQEVRKSGVPILKDIPVLGGLFGSTSRSTRTTELFIFITPHVLRGDEDARVVGDSLIQGTGRLRDRLDELPAWDLSPANPTDGGGRSAPPRTIRRFRGGSFVSEMNGGAGAPSRSWTSKEVTMAEFILLLHEDPSGFAELPPAEIEKVVGEYVGWREQLAEQGRLVGGKKLAEEGGRWLHRENGQVRVVDGPFAEANEVIGGFFMISAADYAEAVEISRGCPHIKHGGRIELREIDPIH